MDIENYLPAFYKRDYGKSNVVTHSAEIFNQIVNDIDKLPKFFDWQDFNTIATMLKLSDNTYKGISVKESSMIKFLSAFKGTKADLDFMSRQLGYEVVVYNDGGYLHKDLKGNIEGIEVVSGYKERTQTPCGIELKAVIDLNADKGYDGLNVTFIKELTNARLNACAYLAKVNIEMGAKEFFNVLEFIKDFIEIKRTPNAIQDAYFREIQRPAIPYSSENNLVYGKHLNNNQVYGSWHFKEFQHLADSLNSTISKSGNSDSLKFLDKLSDSVSIKKVKQSEDSFDTMQLQDSITVFKNDMEI